MFIMADDSEWPKKKYASEQERKSHKPVLEKKRRQRINKSLEALKSLLLDAVKADGAHHSKLEKADILEMTVRHLKEVQRNQLNVAMTVDPTVIRRYQGGFNECSAEVKRYLGTIDGIKPDVKSRLVGHLNNCSNSLNDLSTHQGVDPNQPVFQTPLSTPLYTGQVIEVKPMQVSPELTVVPYGTQPSRVVQGYMQHTQIQHGSQPQMQHQHHTHIQHRSQTQMQHQQQNAQFHIINQQVNQSPSLQHQHPQQLLVHTAVSSAFRQVSPSITPANRPSLSPVYSTPSPHVSPIYVSTEQVSQIDMSSPSFVNHRRQHKPEATISSPSFESESFNSSNETTSTNSEIENKQLGGNYGNLQTLHETRTNDSANSTNNNMGSGITNAPVIQPAKIKSTKLFCHSTPKGRPPLDGNGFSSEHKQNIKNRSGDFSGNNNKENRPLFQLPSNGSQAGQDHMWRPW